MTATPARFVKKPIVIEAMQYTHASCHALHDWAGWPHEDHDEDCDAGIVIETLEGAMTAELGDWIIRGIQGEFYPCKPDIFAATYAPASQPTVDEVTIHNLTSFIEVRGLGEIVRTPGAPLVVHPRTPRVHSAIHIAGVMRGHLPPDDDWTGYFIAVPAEAEDEEICPGLRGRGHRG